VKGSGVVFTHSEGISTPHVRHKRRQPLIKCANMTLCYLPYFHVLMSFYAFYIFYFFVVDEGVSLAPTYSSIVIRKSDLRSSLRTKHLIKFIFLSIFCKICFYWMKGHLRRWTIKQSFDFLEREKTLRHWTINDLFIFERGNKATCWF